MRRLAPIALLFVALTGCQTSEASPVSEMVPQSAVTIGGAPGLVGAWTADHVTADPAPAPAAAPTAETFPDGWHCNGPAYQCRSAEAERQRERELLEWLEEQEDQHSQAREEAEAEANAPHTCEGSGIYGDYSPEGYVDC